MRKAVLAGVLLLLAPWCLAQNRVGSVELTPFTGYWFGDTLTRGTVNQLDFDVDIDDAPAYGLRLGYQFAPHWSVEWMLAREQADLVTAQGDIFGQSKLGDIDITTAEVGFLAAFGNSRLQPFLAGGIGAMRLEPSLAGMRDDTRFVGNFGGGFKLYFTPEFALRFDWRGHSVDVSNRHHDDHCDWWDDCYDHGRDSWLTFQEVSLGLSFVF